MIRCPFRTLSGKSCPVISVSFGFGAHHCVGAALARLEGQEVLAELVTTCRDLTLEIDRPQWVPFLQVRRIESLPLSFRSV